MARLDKSWRGPREGPKGRLSPPYLAECIIDFSGEMTLDRILHQQVAVVAATACNGISAAVKEREEEMAVVSKELDDMHTTLEGIMAKVASTKIT